MHIVKYFGLGYMRMQQIFISSYLCNEKEGLQKGITTAGLL